MKQKNRLSKMLLGGLFVVLILAPHEKGPWIPILKEITVVGTEWWLKLLGVYVYSVDNTLIMLKVQVEISDVCAGFGLVRQTILFAIIIGFMAKLSFQNRWQLILIAPFIAMLANIFRTTLVCLTALRFPTLPMLSRLEVIYGSIIFVCCTIGITAYACYFKKNRCANKEM